MSDAKITFDEILNADTKITIPYNDFSNFLKMQEAIQRVRELAEKYEKFGNDLDPRYAPAAVFQGVAKEIIKALDGRQK